MLRHCCNDKYKGQVLLEYTMVVGVIVAVLMVMNITIKRGIQGMVKVVSDQIGNQEGSDQQFGKSGHMEYSYTSTRASTSKIRSELSGITNYIYEDAVSSNSIGVSNLGFVEDQ